MSALVELPLALVTGTGLAIEPSRTATLGLLRARAARGTRTIFDADWRAQLWEAPEEYPVVAGIAADAASIIVGGDGELEAAGLGPHERRDRRDQARPERRHGARARRRHAHPADARRGRQRPRAGDAFLAAFSAALARGRRPVAAARRGSAAGALVATRLACSDAMPTRPELEAFLGAHA